MYVLGISHAQSLFCPQSHLIFFSGQCTQSPTLCSLPSPLTKYLNTPLASTPSSPLLLKSNSSGQPPLKQISQTIKNACVRDILCLISGLSQILPCILFWSMHTISHSILPSFSPDKVSEYPLLLLHLHPLFSQNPILLDNLHSNRFLKQSKMHVLGISSST